MGSLNNIIAKFSIQIIAFIAGALLILSISKSSSKNEISDLRKDNEKLLLNNSLLTKQNDSLKNSIESSNTLIINLNKKDSSFKVKVENLNAKIKYVKQEYEKANNYANNFNSLDIQRYFSELK